MVLEIVLGAVGGALGSVPGLYLARRSRRGVPASVAAGLAAIMGSLAGLMVLLGIGYEVPSIAFEPFAFGLISTFLGLWWAEAVIAWRWMRPQSSEEVGA